MLQASRRVCRLILQVEIDAGGSHAWQLELDQMRVGGSREVRVDAVHRFPDPGSLACARPAIGDMLHQSGHCEPPIARVLPAPSGAKANAN